MTNPNLVDAQVNLVDGDSSSPFTIKRFQDIPQSFLDRLKEDRNESTKSKMGEFHKVASIPVAVYETWLREGYDATKEPITKTVAKLKAEGLDYFMATDRKI